MNDQEKELRAELARREMCRRSYAEYLPYVQGKGWVRTRFSEYLARRVQEFVETPTGHAFDILIIQTPPQHGKSMTVTSTFPAWYLGKHPTHRVILASYNDDFAEAFNRQVRDKVARFGPTLFGLGIGKTNRATGFSLANEKGKIISRGIRSGITGNPGDLIIIDDPIKNRAEAYSEAFRDQLWGEWQNSIKTRLSAGAKVVVIATPWHFDDLMARIQANEVHVDVCRLPVAAEENDPLGRKPGEALCPEIGKDDAWLADFKPSYVNDADGGLGAWQAMYQCTPRIEGGNIIKRSWFQDYDPDDVLAWGQTIISVDATFKGLETSDFVAITVWSKVRNDYYLRHVTNRHLDFAATVATIRSIRQLYPEAWTTIIEDKANGPAIIQTLQHEMFVIPVNPRGGKESRLNAVAPAIESGHVYIPKSFPLREDYLNQFAGFPTLPHDDMVDSTTQALMFLLNGSGDPLHDNRPPDPLERQQQNEEEAFLNGDILYDVYGGSGDRW